MYLKSLEIHGFKSFANKIVFEFHNGITGIVGPNGSGKSNVGDAVRWVLGEQSAKQLRGASMQDVIFAGTENRKPLSYAYVAITLDNSDHKLAIDFEEVTIARRVYRSGESEYLINGSPCRLKDVSELFYDTGIGKEGYSIIGQGQIDRILSGKPEERRELFDEAAGIVKYKKRKNTAQKKLEDERDNLTRVNDILSELERQVGPLERQSEKAKTYLKKKEELKHYDVNMFLLETDRIESEQKETEEKFRIADSELEETKESFFNVKRDYEEMEHAITEMDDQITDLRERLNQATLMKGKLEGQINVLNEQIHTAETTDEHLKGRLDAIDAEKAERMQAKDNYVQKKEELDLKITDILAKRDEVQEKLLLVQQEIETCNRGIEKGKNEIIELLNNKASIKARKQRFDTMTEQINIRKAQLNQRLLARKTEEADLQNVLTGYLKELEAANQRLEAYQQKEKELSDKIKNWKVRLSQTGHELEETQTGFHKQQSRLDSLKNIAERYDGYGNSIRRVMEQKSFNPGIHGVVSDLIQTEKKYEIAIETALGGSIQNIVTENEDTAKKMIAYLKENRYGRATFLPLTSVQGRSNPKLEEHLRESGVIGIADRLVKCEEKYKGIASHLLGRILVVDNIDHAAALARKNRYSLNIVTLEGEHLSPGGSMTGGAFRNSNNLLARKREIEELEHIVSELSGKMKDLRNRQEEIRTAASLAEDDLAEIKEELQKQYILQNTAQMNFDRAKEQRSQSENVFHGLQSEVAEIDHQLGEIQANKAKIDQEITDSRLREKEIEEENTEFQSRLDELSSRENTFSQEVSTIRLEEANVRQSLDFAMENIQRIDAEIRKFDQERTELVENAQNAKNDVQKKQDDIEEIKKTIQASDKAHEELEKALSESLVKKQEMTEAHKGFFQKREEISRKMNDLDKEIYRLNSQREKLKEADEKQINYMWEEYELTPHAAAELRDENDQNLSDIKKKISEIRDEIRKLGDVNVNAIEEFKEVSERYTFLKTQHDDLIEAEKTLMGIIEELDTGMRKQFAEKFKEIQTEFDKTFKMLFGGGHGSLELVEEEDILECGIRIIAQPPGKKLQNMMQLSGGEKALTAIALLFAIQALKPSPFCLLDEIEAALDDSNVGRFANYLNKLTENTQFIVITHRRGTMAAADRLYGITMQEKGVSTLVSVNLIENDLTE